MNICTNARIVICSVWFMNNFPSSCATTSHSIRCASSIDCCLIRFSAQNAFTCCRPHCSSASITFWMLNEWHLGLGPFRSFEVSEQWIQLNYFLCIMRAFKFDDSSPLVMKCWAINLTLKMFEWYILLLDC